MRVFQKPQLGWFNAILRLHYLPQLTRLISITVPHVDSVVALYLEATAEKAFFNPEVDYICQIRTSTEGVVKDFLFFSLQETLTSIKEQSDLVAEEACNVSIPVGWGTLRKIALLLDNNNKD